MGVKNREMGHKIQNEGTCDTITSLRPELVISGYKSIDQTLALGIVVDIIT